MVQGCKSVRVFKVEHNAVFVGVQVVKQSAGFRVGAIFGKRPSKACRVPTLTLNLDHLGTEVAKQLGTKRPSGAIAQINHTQAIEWPALCFVLLHVNAHQ